MSAHSLNALCRLIGLSKPSFYRTFGSEDGLMTAALDHYRELAIVPLLGLLAADEPFAQLLDASLEWLTSDHGAPAGCLFTRMRLSSARLGPSTKARVREIEQERRAAFTASYQRGLERGEVDQTLSASFAAYFIDTQLTAALVQRAAGDPPDMVKAQTRLAFRTLLIQ
ncbi:MAG: TetR/AcrR family transcriptional regulator [Myxococcota bacterium]